MKKEKKMEKTDEELKPMMVSLLETGFDITMFDDDLKVFQSCDGKYFLFENVEEHMFEKADDAVDLFLKLRREWLDWMRPEYDLTKIKLVPPEIRQRRHAGKSVSVALDYETDPKTGDVRIVQR